MPVTYFPDQTPRSQAEQRQWSHLIKLPGVRSGMRIPVSCRLVSCRYQLMTPRRVRVLAEIELSTSEIQLASPEGPRIRWKSIPESIPAASASVSVSHMLNVHKDLPAIQRVTELQSTVRVEQTTTLRDRLVVKGALSLVMKYAVRN